MTMPTMFHTLLVCCLLGIKMIYGKYVFTTDNFSFTVAQLFMM